MYLHLNAGASERACVCVCVMHKHVCVRMYVSHGGICTLASSQHTPSCMSMSVCVCQGLCGGEVHTVASVCVCVCVSCTQVYVKGEFVGGADILYNMHEEGELETLLGPIIEEQEKKAKESGAKTDSCKCC